MVTIRVKEGTDELLKLCDIIAANVKFPYDPKYKRTKDGTVYWECYFSDYDYRNNKEALDAVNTEIEGVKVSMKEKINKFLNKPGTLEVILGGALVAGTAVISYICYSNGIETGKMLGVKEGYEKFQEQFAPVIDDVVHSAYDIGMDCFEKDIRNRMPDAADIIDAYRKTDPEWRTTVPGAIIDMREGIVRLVEES